MIQTTEQLVYNALTSNEKARQDDYILYGLILKNCGIDLHISLGSFLINHKKLKAPSFKSVERARRKLEAKHSELIDKETKQMRDEAQERFKEYSRE